MNLQQLKDDGFIKPKTIERMRKTTAGTLAGCLSELIYHLVEKEVGGKIELPLAIIHEEPYNEQIGKQCRVKDSITERYFESKKILWQILHYLEACALRDVQD